MRKTPYRASRISKFFAPSDVYERLLSSKKRACRTHPSGLLFWHPTAADIIDLPHSEIHWA
jgi:hypothetical protein